MEPQPEETKPEVVAAPDDSDETELELSTTPQKQATTKLKNSTTKPKAKGGRPRKAPDTGVWGVRGVDVETRAIIEKTADRAGKTIGQFVNEDVRAYCQSQLTQSQLPASPRDLQVQVEQLTQMVESIAAKMNEPARKSFWQRVLGK
jgi:predicted hydrocarbon binding protein